MKKLLIASLLLFNASAFAKTTEYTGVTATPNDVTSTVQRVNSYIWGQDTGANPGDRRMAVDVNGNVLTAPGTGASGSTTISAIVGTAATSYFDKLTSVALVTVSSQMTPLTFASSVQGSSMLGLTFSSMASLTVVNNGTKVLGVILTNSSTAPTNTTTVYEGIQPASQKVWSAKLGSLSSQDTVLHWYSVTAETVSGTAVYRY